MKWSSTPLCVFTFFPISPAAWAIFLLWSIPLPVIFGGLLKLAEGNAPDADASGKKMYLFVECVHYDVLFAFTKAVVCLHVQKI